MSWIEKHTESIVPVLVVVGIIGLIIWGIFATAKDSREENQRLQDKYDRFRDTIYAVDGLGKPRPISKIESAKGTIGWFNGHFSGFLGVNGDISGKQTQSMTITVYWKKGGGVQMNTLPISKVKAVRSTKPTITFVFRFGDETMDRVLLDRATMTDSEFVEKYTWQYCMALPPNIFDREFGG